MTQISLISVETVRGLNWDFPSLRGLRGAPAPHASTRLQSVGFSTFLQCLGNISHKYVYLRYDVQVPFFNVSKVLRPILKALASSF